jgi:hypothetical protein
MEGINGIIEQLEAQKAAIENALAALREFGGAEMPAVPAAKRGRPAKRKGGMTPEGRKRLAEAMRRRWAVKRTAAAKKRGRAKKSV